MISTNKICKLHWDIDIVILNAVQEGRYWLMIINNFGRSFRLRKVLEPKGWGNLRYRYPDAKNTKNKVWTEAALIDKDAASDCHTIIINPACGRGSRSSSYVVLTMRWPNLKIQDVTPSCSWKIQVKEMNCTTYLSHKLELHQRLPRRNEAILFQRRPLEKWPSSLNWPKLGRIGAIE